MKIHELKVWPEFYNAVVSGDKTFELRRNDRPGGYCVGDRLILKEWKLGVGFTGREAAVEVTYVMSGIMPFPNAPDLSGWVIMSIQEED